MVFRKDKTLLVFMSFAIFFGVCVCVCVWGGGDVYGDPTNSSIFLMDYSGFPN